MQLPLCFTTLLHGIKYSWLQKEATKLKSREKVNTVQNKCDPRFTCCSWIYHRGVFECFARSLYACLPDYGQILFLKSQDHRRVVKLSRNQSIKFVALGPNSENMTKTTCLQVNCPVFAPPHSPWHQWHLELATPPCWTSRKWIWRPPRWKNKAKKVPLMVTWGRFQKTSMLKCPTCLQHVSKKSLWLGLPI